MNRPDTTNRPGPASGALDTAYAVGWAVAKRMPEPVARAIFAQVGDLIWRQHGSGVRRLESNLSRARPDLDDVGIRQLSRAAMRSYLRYWCEAFRLPVWSRDDVLTRISAENEQALRGAHAAGDGVVIALPHMANWDLAGAWACLTGMPLTTVAEHLEPERLFERFLDYRRSLGMEVLSATGGASTFRTLVERARAGRLIALVADRDLSASGIEVELLGQPARMPAGPAAIARSTGAVLLPATLHYTEHGMRIWLHEPVEPVPGAQGLQQMTQSLADAFSRGIAIDPQDWHMLQRVFAADVGQRPRGGR